MTKTLGIRLSEEMEQQLEALTESMKLKKSQVMKRAFHEWVRTREGVTDQNMLMCDGVLISALFDELDDEQITQIAEQVSEHIVSKIRIRQIEHGETDETPGEFLTHFTRIIGPQHFGWFNRVDYTSIPDEAITLYGVHSLNLNYSKYTYELLARVISKMFGYVKTSGKQRVTENSFILEIHPASSDPNP